VNEPYCIPLLSYIIISLLGGVMLSVLAIGPKVREFKSCRRDGFLKAIRIRSTSFFGGEVKPSPHVVIFYGMLKNHAYVVWQIYYVS
jgi:hypothetical protein